MKTVILAYSGGLDTSVCLSWLRDRGYRVVALLVDVGQGEDFARIERRALKNGADKVYIRDGKQEFVSRFVFPALKAGAVYEGKYLLATALSRPLIAEYLVQAAAKERAGYIAHGCTGKGNDQVRFELSCNILKPRLKIIAPVRCWEFKSREEEIDYLDKKGIASGLSKEKIYSIDRNLWGISIECGALEDPWAEPPKDAWQISKDIDDTPHKPRYIEICFERGEPWYLDGKEMQPRELIRRLNDIGGGYGVGRSDLVESRLVGIKTREIYETPAATILSCAHQALENLVLDRELLHFKQRISLKYAQLVYYGLWHTPLKAALDKFIAETQKKVTGSVRLKLHKGSCAVVGRRSPHSLYKKELATYSADDKFEQGLAEGFIRLWGMPYLPPLVYR